MNNPMICNGCFEDEKIQNYIKTNGEKANDGYKCICGADSDYEYEEFIYLLNKQELAKKLIEIIEKLYVHENEHGMGYSARSYVEGDEDPFEFAGLSDLEDICYDYFGDNLIADFIIENKPFINIADSEDDYYESKNYRVWQDRCYFENDEEDEFSLSKWQKFCENVKHKARYFDHEDFSVSETLADFNDFFEQIVFNSLDESLYRARKIYTPKDWEDIAVNPDEELGSVPIEYAKNNRFSPIGISYGYFAFEEDTVLKEIRATISDEVAIGEFNLNSALKIIDFRFITMHEKFLNYFDDDFNEKFYCISHFIHEFITDISKPVSDDKQLLEYIPTQIMSEYIWSKGYDGFLFDSSVNSGGTNLVLFAKKYSFNKHTRYIVKSIDMTLEELK